MRAHLVGVREDVWVSSVSLDGGLAVFGRLGLCTLNVRECPSAWVSVVRSSHLVCMCAAVKVRHG